VQFSTSGIRDIALNSSVERIRILQAVRVYAFDLFVHVVPVSLLRSSPEMETRVEASILRPLCSCVAVLLLSWCACAFSLDLRISQLRHLAADSWNGAFKVTEGSTIEAVTGRNGEPAVRLTTDSDGRVWLGYPNSEQPPQDVGARREAYFTNLAPEHYRFGVIGSNNYGVWNEAGAAVDFDLPPAFIQTKWILAICVTAGALVPWLLWTLRLRQMQARRRDRLEARLLERERIAQELHDTLLQGLISASLQLAVANREISPCATAKPLVERVSRLLCQMIDEGRNAVRGLRTRHSDRDDLECAFAQIPQDLAADENIKYRLIVEGTPRALRPLIRAEVYRIGRESLANAFRHSQASVIETVLQYTQDRFRIVVRDDGRGIDPEVLRSGREGHWGLPGMRERSEKIGARLSVLTAAGAGTEIGLTIPGGAAFQRCASGGWVHWLARIYSRRATP
jgi:signal transduction histidine kinase